jgi:hypothetical protein
MNPDSQPARDERLDASVQRTDRGIEPRWPAEHWWCLTCGEGSEGDPCQFCGNTIKRYRVIPVAAHEAALAAARQVDEAMVERAAEAHWEGQRIRRPWMLSWEKLHRLDRIPHLREARAALLAALNPGAEWKQK